MLKQYMDEPPGLVGGGGGREPSQETKVCIIIRWSVTLLSTGLVAWGRKVIVWSFIKLHMCTSVNVHQPSK